MGRNYGGLFSCDTWSGIIQGKEIVAPTRQMGTLGHKNTSGRSEKGMAEGEKQKMQGSS